MQRKSALIVGAGSAGLIAAKELKEKNFSVRVIDKGREIGGIWRNLSWKSYTLTSSKWVTEYGCFPMPDDYPDFITNEQMLAYLESFVDHFDLRQSIELETELKSVKPLANGRLQIDTTREQSEIDYLVISTGLHGEPHIPEFPGIDHFGGKVLHSSAYVNAESFRNQKVLCVGLGESGVGLVSELAEVSERLLVASEGVAVAPRTIKNTQNPFDQMQFWKLGQYMISYQEVLTSGLSWFHRNIPRFLKKFSVSANLRFYSDHAVPFEQIEPWLPKALVPHHFHVKFWSKPADCPTGGNLTQVQAPADDLFYLIKTGRLTPKGRVREFDESGALFADGSREEFDTVIFNTGYRPGAMKIEFPQQWEYRHSDLFQGCIHPIHPNIGFIGMVRPTIGSIPAMAEMHARLVAAYFSDTIPLPDEAGRKEAITRGNEMHREKYPAMHDRFPHIYFFDQWMEQTADLIGAKPKLRDLNTSFAQLRAFFLGAPMPLRFRIVGPGNRSDAAQIYAERVAKVWGNAFGKWALTTVLIHFLFPFLISAAAGILAFSYLDGSISAGMAAALVSYLAYRSIDILRFLLETSIARSLSLLAGVFFIKRMKMDSPNYLEPKVFQSLK